MVRSLTDLVDEELGIHLSSNQRLYVYAETAEEGVIQTYKILTSAKQDWKSIPVVTGLRSTSNRYRINALLTQDFVWRLFQSLLGMTSTHYIHSDIFKISSLTTNLLSPHGGVSVTPAHENVLKRKTHLCVITDTSCCCDLPRGSLENVL